MFFLTLFASSVNGQMRTIEVVRLGNDSTVFVKFHDQEVYRAWYIKEDDTYQVFSSSDQDLKHSLVSSKHSVYIQTEIAFEKIENYEAIRNFFHAASTNSSVRTELTDILIDSAVKQRVEVNPYRSDDYMFNFAIGSVVGLFIGYYFAVELSPATFFTTVATPIAAIPMVLMLIGKTPQLIGKIITHKNWGPYRRYSPTITAAVLSTAPGCAAYLSALAF